MAHDENTTHDLDSPTPPGGPLRQDAPTADVTPGPAPAASSTEEPQTPPEPTVQPSSPPDGPQVVPSPSTPEGEPGPDPAQAENAATSLDQPSDNSGAE